MAEKVGYFMNITSALLLVLLLLLPLPNLCHNAVQESQCRFLDNDLLNSKGADGVGIPLMKSSCDGCSGRRTSISPRRMNLLVVAVASVVLLGINVAVFAYLCLKSMTVAELHMMSIRSHMGLLVYALDGFDEYDGIISRGRIRTRGDH